MQLVPIHEFNRCHTPAGSSAGGQFCGVTARPGGGQWYSFERAVRVKPVGTVPFPVNAVDELDYYAPDYEEKLQHVLAAAVGPAPTGGTVVYRVADRPLLKGNAGDIPGLRRWLKQAGPRFRYEQGGLESFRGRKIYTYVLPPSMKFGEFVTMRRGKAYR